MNISSLLVAYIDPGTGAILLQALLAMLLTCGVLFRRIVFAPLRLVFRGQGGQSAGTVADQQGHQPAAESIEANS